MDKTWLAKEQLQLVHNDICGRLEALSQLGVMYFITFIDDYSRKTWVYFLKYKSEASIMFQELKALVEKELGKNIKILRIDIMREYNKHECF